jgi:hypothetical protein
LTGVSWIGGKMNAHPSECRVMRQANRRRLRGARNVEECR